MEDVRPFLFFAFWIRGALFVGIPGLIVGWLALRAGRRRLGYSVISAVVAVGALMAILIATAQVTGK